MQPEPGFFNGSKAQGRVSWARHPPPRPPTLEQGSQILPNLSHVCRDVIKPRQLWDTRKVVRVTEDLDEGTRDGQVPAPHPAPSCAEYGLDWVTFKASYSSNVLES